MAAHSSQSSALRTAIRLTIGVVESLRGHGPVDWAEQLRDFVARIKISGLRDRRLLDALLSVVHEEMQRCSGVSTARSGDLRPERIDAMLERFEHDARLITSEPELRGGRAARVRRVATFIEQHYAEPLTLERLAAMVGCHRVCLATEFRRETGVTVHNFLTRVRVRQAADLLRAGEKIEPVSMLVGYRGKKNFYRHFKQQMGMTPGAYKDQNRGDAVKSCNAGLPR